MAKSQSHTEEPLPLLLLLLVVLVSPSVAKDIKGSTAPAMPATEVRALWVDGFNPGIRTRAEAEQLVATAHRAGINLLFVQVRRRGDALYANGLEPFAEDIPAEPGFDPLANIIELAHRDGIQVHAWINAMPIWGKNGAPRDPNHVFNLHGPGHTGRDNWLTASPDGQMLFPVGYFLDPGHPDAMNHLVAIYTSIARNYDVDGIHFDYIRYPETDKPPPQGAPVGYNATSLERFRRATGRSDTPDPADPQWSDWRRRQVTQLVRRVYLEVKAINPRIVVSAALIPWGKPPEGDKDYPNTAPMQRVFQDWNGWLRQGWLDMAVPMNYARESDPRVRAWFDGWIRWEKRHKYGRELVIGLGSYLNTPDQTLAQMQRARKSAHKFTADGVSLFSYAAFMKNPQTETLAFLGTEANTPFATAASVPRPVWLEQPLLGWVAGTIHARSGEPADNARVEVRRAGWWPFRHKDTTLADGNGFFGLAGLKPGRYEVKSGATKAPIEIQVGKVTQVELNMAK